MAPARLSIVNEEKGPTFGAIRAEYPGKTSMRFIGIHRTPAVARISVDRGLGPSLSSISLCPRDEVRLEWSSRAQSRRDATSIARISFIFHFSLALGVTLHHSTASSTGPQAHCKQGPRLYFCVPGAQRSL